MPAESSCNRRGIRCQLPRARRLGRALLDNLIAVGPSHDRPRRWWSVGVEHELIRGEVWTHVVEDVCVAGRCGEHDDDGDEHPDADRRQSGTRACSVAGEISQCDPRRDRRLAGPASR